MAECCFSSGSAADVDSSSGRLNDGFRVNAFLTVASMFLQPLATPSYGGFLAESMFSYFLLSLATVAASAIVGFSTHYCALCCCSLTIFEDQQDPGRHRHLPANYYSI